MIRIVIFGDSIAYGAYDKEGGWTRRLENLLRERTTADPGYRYHIHNFSIPGDTTEWLLKRFESEVRGVIEQRTADGTKENRKIIFIFAVGINDSKVAHKSGKSLVSVEEFRKNIQKLIEEAKRYSSNVVFVGLTSVDEKKLEPITSPFGYVYKNGNIKTFEDTIKDVCEKFKVHFIPVFKRFAANGHEELLEDGIHPNSFGHQKIFEIVKDFLIENGLV